MYRPKSEKRTWKVALGILILMCCFAVQSLTGSYANAQQPDKRLISVTGEYTLYVKPDVARVSFGVETDGKTAKEAQSTNSKLMNQVISKLASCGISKEDIQTSNFSLYPIYEMPEDGRGTRAVLISYRCNNTVTVRIKDVSKTGEIIDAAVNAGATNVTNISFGVLDSKKYEDQVLAKAVENARHKAEVMAKAAGVTIKDVFSISDGWVSVSSTRDYMKIAQVELDSSPIEPGEVAISAAVRMEFIF